MKTIPIFFYLFIGEVQYVICVLYVFLFIFDQNGSVAKKMA